MGIEVCLFPESVMAGAGVKKLRFERDKCEIDLLEWFDREFERRDHIFDQSTTRFTGNKINF